MPIEPPPSLLQLQSGGDGGDGPDGDDSGTSNSSSSSSSDRSLSDGGAQRKSTTNKSKSKDNIVGSPSSLPAITDTSVPQLASLAQASWTSGDRS